MSQKMSDEETVLLTLFDSLWFEYGAWTAKPPSLISKLIEPVSPVHRQVLQQQQQQQQQEHHQDSAASKPKLTRITTMMRKSSSDQFLSSKAGSESPKSVLAPHLQTIPSGKEVRSFREKEDHKGKGPSRRKKSSSRSLSELEFEEMKGFMDMGFVFSDEDKDSRLVSIIPGLQRHPGKELSSVSRPYLSEAWEYCPEPEQDRKKKQMMMDWKLPAFGSETELKRHLRFWAHSVASTVIS